MSEYLVKLQTNNYYNELRNLLIGHVFHVTCNENYIEIVKSLAVAPNTLSKNESPFGLTVNGFFRKRNCVSMFDYRECTSDGWLQHEYDCLPTMPLAKCGKIAVMYLVKNDYYKLISWENWKSENAYSDRIVPYIEIGHPGPIYISSISDVIIVEASQG